MFAVGCTCPKVLGEVHASQDQPNFTSGIVSRFDQSWQIKQEIDRLQDGTEHPWGGVRLRLLTIKYVVYSFGFESGGYAEAHPQNR